MDNNPPKPSLVGIKKKLKEAAQKLESAQAQEEEAVSQAPVAPPTVNVPSKPVYEPSFQRLEDRTKILPKAPLAALLPVLGQVSDVAKLRSRFEKRHQELIQKASEEASAERSARSTEESMLGQVNNWLSMGMDDE